jgi:hypothetical protein
MYAVIGFGDPSYTSGAHMWNGTVETLKPKYHILDCLKAGKLNKRHDLGQHHINFTCFIILDR